MAIAVKHQKLNVAALVPIVRLHIEQRHSDQQDFGPRGPVAADHRVGVEADGIAFWQCDAAPIRRVVFAVRDLNGIGIGLLDDGSRTGATCVFRDESMGQERYG